jgi:hypothetical protein
MEEMGFPTTSPENVILCCLIREDTHFGEAVVDGYGEMLESTKALERKG